MNTIDRLKDKLGIDTKDRTAWNLMQEFFRRINADSNADTGSSRTSGYTSETSRSTGTTAGSGIIDLSDICSDDFKLTIPGAENVSREEAERIFTELRDCSTDWSHLWADLTHFSSDDGSQVLIRDSRTFNQDGELRLPDGRVIQSTGNRVRLYWAYVAHCKDGLLDKLDVYPNMEHLLSQLGHKPALADQMHMSGNSDLNRY
jgi:hypothetical protein